MSSSPVVILGGGALADYLHTQLVRDEAFHTWEGSSGVTELPSQTGADAQTTSSPENRPDVGPNSTPVLAEAALAIALPEFIKAYPSARFVGIERAPLDVVRHWIGAGHQRVTAELDTLDANPELSQRLTSLFTELSGVEAADHCFTKLGLLSAYRTAMAREVLSSLPDQQAALVCETTWRMNLDTVTAQLLDFLGAQPQEATNEGRPEGVFFQDDSSEPEALMHADIETYLRNLAALFGIDDLPTATFDWETEGMKTEAVLQPLKLQPSVRVALVDDQVNISDFDSIRRGQILHPISGTFGLLPIADGSLEHLLCLLDLSSVRRAERVALFRDARRSLSLDGTLSITGFEDDQREPIALEAQCAGLSVKVAPPREFPLEAEFLHFGLPDRSVNDEAPLVSLLIPAFNPRYIKECLLSAVNQSWENLEILVGDDCPNDGVETIVRAFQREDDRIVYHRNNPPSGATNNLQGLLDRASGEFIKYLCDDDLLAPSCVVTMLTALLNHPRATLVSSQRNLIDENGTKLPVGSTNTPLSEVDYYAEGISLMDTLLRAEFNALGEPTTVMFRKNDLNWVEPNLVCIGNHEADWNGDLVMWVNLLGRGDAIYLASNLSSFRIHGGQLSSKSNSTTRGLVDWARLRRAVVEFGFLRPRGTRQIMGRPLMSISGEVTLR